jgi:hypothetical protein
MAIEARMASSTGPRAAHRLARDQIRGDRRERDGQLLDHGLAEDLADGVEDLLGPQHPAEVVTDRAAAAPRPA